LSEIKGDVLQGQDHTPGYMRDIFYSVSLILMTSGIKDDKKERLYKLIINKLQENSALIKEGGKLDIYYVASSELECNVKECYRDAADGEGKIIPSISEVISLNNVINNKLSVNIYVFTCDTFFRKYLKFPINNVFYPDSQIDRKNSKL
jgi:hypothetical protein